jgi:lysophospholipase L1-like esterase
MAPCKLGCAKRCSVARGAISPLGLAGFSVRMLVIVQLLLAFCAVLMGFWAKCPVPGIIGLGLVGAAAVAAQLAPAAAARRFFPWIFGLGLAAALWVPVHFWRTGDVSFASVDAYWRQYCAVLGWLIVVLILPLSHQAVRAAAAVWWRKPLLAAALGVGLLWIGTAYAQNSRAAFFLALLAVLGLLFLCKIWFRPSWLVVQMINSCILLLLALPPADLVWSRVTRPADGEEARPGAARYWTYRAAKEDPAGFERWWAIYAGSWPQFWGAVVDSEPAAPVPLQLRPGAHTVFVRCPISINSQGFRGKEITEPKGKTYRIVALGESTTFGWTLGPEDKPWPELLEQLVRERLKPDRPVEVINAGVPGATLCDNLLRLRDQILPLQPDMILSYHGVNGFYLLDEAIPTTRGRAQPAYCDRPLRLLARCEYHVKLMLYERELARAVPKGAPPLANPLQTKYARAYEQLIDFAQTNRIRLVLANFSMAANDQSPPEVVEFYRRTCPPMRAFIQANLAHSRLLTDLARAHPWVCLVDTHPRLDGDTEKYLDAFHFNPDGDAQVAENIFAGISNVLSAELSRSAQ